MSIASEINRISQNVADSLTAVANKGVTVPSGSTSDDLPGLIAQITGGGGAITIVDTPDPAGGVIREIIASEAYIDGDNLAYGGADSAIVGVGTVGQMRI